MAAAQSVVEAEGGHAAAGLVKVQTTAGGTLRQMRLPCAPSRCRRSRKARGIGRRRAVGELHQRRAPRGSASNTPSTMPFTTPAGSDSKRQARHDGGDRRDAMVGEQPRQARGIALDDARSGEMTAQEDRELGIALDQREPLRRDAGGQQRLGDLAGAGAQLDDMARPAFEDGLAVVRHRLGKQPAARHHRAHGQGAAQPALQEKGRAGRLNRGHGRTLTDDGHVSTGKNAVSYCAGCIAGPGHAGAGAVSNTVRACRICSSAFTIET